VIVLVRWGKQDKGQAAPPRPETPGAGQPSGPSPPGPDWQPDPALLAKLEPETTIQGCRLRPPKGYEYQQQQTAYGFGRVPTRATERRQPFWRPC
jgi:hypothetical protein